MFGLTLTLFLKNLPNEDWAGVHAWMSVHRPDGSADAFDTMAFYHFVEGGDGTIKVDKCWIKENNL